MKTSGLKLRWQFSRRGRSSALDARRRPDSTVDLLVANEGRVAVPCQDHSRRRRWPKASLYKGLSHGHARSPRATIECACGDKCSGTGKCPHPAANSPEVNVLREMGKFKPVIFGQIHAAGDTRSCVERLLVKWSVPGARVLERAKITDRTPASGNIFALTGQRHETRNFATEASFKMGTPSGLHSLDARNAHSPV